MKKMTTNKKNVTHRPGACLVPASMMAGNMLCLDHFLGSTDTRFVLAAVTVNGLLLVCCLVLACIVYRKKL